MKSGLRTTVLGAAFFFCLGCGAGPQPAVQGAEDGSGATDDAAIQLYLILTDEESAMQTQGEVDAMWSAIKDPASPYGSLRGTLWAIPVDFALDVELDFASLPHRSLSPASLERMVSPLDQGVRDRAKKAKLGLSMRVESQPLPGGAQVRLGGLAALFCAERYNGVILDLLTRRAYTPKTWRETLARPELWPGQVRLLRRRSADGTYTLETRGHPKFGLPDLQITGIPSTKLSAAMERLGTAREAVWAQGQHPTHWRKRLGKRWPLTPCAKGSYDVACVGLASP